MEECYRRSKFGDRIVGSAIHNQAASLAEVPLHRLSEMERYGVDMKAESH